jgi:hypothetical protein
MMHIRDRGLTLTLMLGLLFAACSGTQAETSSDTQLPADHPAATGGTAQEGAPTAVVLETMNSGGYTYARVSVGEDEMWTAGPEAQLAVGDSITLYGAMPMSNFRSNTLDRTFEQIVFLAQFAKYVVPPEPAEGAVPAALVPKQGTVIQSMEAAGYTYVEVRVDGGIRWLAGPRTEVAEGDLVEWLDEMPMQNFKSSTLDRTFEELFFVGALSVVR